MGRALHDAFPAAREVFEEVDAALGEPFSALVFEGPEDRLTLTENAQPALMATSLAALRAIEAAAGRDIAQLAAFVAGHSLGEYSALAAAGALQVGDAARLLRLRGQAMQAAVPVGDGAMAAVLGLDFEAVRDIAADAAGDEVCDVANDNAAGQVVVSGHRDAVERAAELAKERGARRCTMLNVSAPFHCRLMAPAAEAMQAALAETRLESPRVPVIANVTAEPSDDPDAIRAQLVRQVTATVRWRESMARMAELGVDHVVEVGAGKVLTGLARRGVPGATVSNVQSPEDVAALLSGISG
jgi:[acyl-carrier-protein] S-malonyltransferase